MFAFSFSLLYIGLLHLPKTLGLTFERRAFTLMLRMLILHIGTYETLYHFASLSSSTSSSWLCLKTKMVFVVVTLPASVLQTLPKVRRVLAAMLADHRLSTLPCHYPLSRGAPAQVVAQPARQGLQAQQHLGMLEAHQAGMLEAPL